MIHYNVWFRFKNDITEREGLGVVYGFLNELRHAAAIAGFRLFKNIGIASNTRMLPFQAIIEFSDEAQFSSTFTAQARSGIHNGFHGRVLAIVSDFQIEVFTHITDFKPPSDFQTTGLYACEI
jgi:hypothetical protein